ncbi:transcriptional regulator [Candidatus Bathyarchaeota archaeon]|nr:MAG: transcriptional regulator [Candidatus Bathyarchaeota archaeon]
MLLKQILASTCRQKIVETLARVEQIHMMELVRKTNSTYSQISRNLRILSEEGVVTVKRFGRVKIVQLNRESEKTQALLKALNVLARVDLTSRD